MDLSMASSISLIVILSRRSRTAKIAASFIILAISAPEKPVVREARAEKSTSSAIVFPRAWTLKIASRPSLSGKSTVIWRSKRPARNKAGSKTSARLVAAIIITPELSAKPSISTNNWFNVCSLSSFPPPKPAPLWRPTASISSINTKQGALFLAVLNISRTREAPTPTYISTKSDPEIE